MVGCTHGSTKKSPSPEPLGRGAVVLEHQGRTSRVTVEVARTEQQRARGLMYRKKLSPHQGMLFLFDRDEIQSFWMKNTYIPLDMLFISDAKVVVGIVENAPPMTEAQQQVDAPSRFVLEVRGGFCASQGIGVGARARFELD